MCGFAGFLDSSQVGSQSGLLALAGKMNSRLSHRGPDAAGGWADPETGLALGHRRLAILDLSPEGAQPMLSHDGRFVIAFNGEIYNHGNIRLEVDRFTSGRTAWRGRSDTEVMLTAISLWGVREALQRFEGMFAFALWDRNERVLILARDRIGEKPLYHGWVGKALLFGSELKSFRVFPDWKGEINRDAIALMMRFNCIPDSHCIYKDFHKLPPGHLMTVSPRSGGRPDVSLEAYWKATDAVAGAKKNAFRADPAEALEHLDRELRGSIARQMMADVPLGAFLSGGIDSSLIVALMQAQSPRPVKTFTIGFKQEGYNEAEQAREVARHIGTEHHELYLEWDRGLEVIGKLPALYDEPFSDSSQIPTYLVSKMARESVKVCLSGDGGDELFGGYNRYTWGPALWKRIGWLPTAMRKTAAMAIATISPQSWDRGFSGLKSVIPDRLSLKNPGEKVHKFAENMGASNPMDMYRGFLSHWRNPSALVLGATEPTTELDRPEGWPYVPTFAETMMYLDLVGYLPGDILVKVDRAAMGVSLETRIPFLSHKVLDIAWRLPLEFKIRGGQGKWLLRQLLYRHVPRELVDRPKMGFAVPLGDWLRGPLRDWAEALLSEHRLKCEGYFRSDLIREKWKEHLSGRRNWQFHLWDVLMFQAWLEAENVTDVL